MREIIVDTSVLIAVLLGEEQKDALIELTDDATLLAPLSVHWEIGNALSALFIKRQRINLEQALEAIDTYLTIPIRFVEVELSSSLVLANDVNIYAYDAYLLRCAEKYRLPLLTLDRRLKEVAQQKGFSVLEVL